MSDDRAAVFRGKRAVVIAAHPDDEAIGCSALMAWFGRGCTVIHVTDGGPRDLVPASVGFPSREAYAEARRREAIEAASVAGLGEDQLLVLGIIDKEAALELVSLSRRLFEMLRSLEPDVVVVHPYEGGHPDHDASAFAARAAVDALERAGEAAPALLEFTSYHRWEGSFRAFEFLPGGADPVWTVQLDEAELRRKQQMFDRYATQRQMLTMFPIAVERYRRAPRYDFALPPHPGTLQYETFPSGMTADRWVALARDAIEILAAG